MKKSCFILTASLFFAGCGSTISSPDSVSSALSEEISGKVQVIVLLGQSNMEGHTHAEYLSKTCGEEKAAEYASGYEDVKIDYECLSGNRSDGFVPVRTGQGKDPSRFGPEVGMAEYFHERNYKTPIFLVKYALGATSLTNQWQPPSTGKTGSLYLGAVNDIKSCMRDLEDRDFYPEIKAICWMQGEDDSTGNLYRSYFDYERALVSDLREDLLYYSAPSGIGFIDAGISDCPAWTHQEEINTQKKTLSELSELNEYFSTIEENLRYNGEPAGAPDIYHYDSSSMIRLGRLFAEHAEKFLEA